MQMPRQGTAKDKLLATSGCRYDGSAHSPATSVNQLPGIYASTGSRQTELLFIYCPLITVYLTGRSSGGK